jgi:hypothetical protein
MPDEYFYVIGPRGLDHRSKDVGGAVEHAAQKGGRRILRAAEMNGRHYFPPYVNDHKRGNVARFFTENEITVLPGVAPLPDWIASLL